MKMHSFSTCGLLLVAAIGCGQAAPETADSGKSQPAAAAPMQNNVAQANATPEPVVTSGAGTEPGEIVALFLDSLRRGDENAANGVLTSTAQAELAKTDYVIQPLGTPDGSYKIGRVGFVDGDTSVGLVECLWTEPNPEAGQPPIELDIVCEVRKEPEGWRISGLAVKMSGTDDTLVLDFEDAKSLQQALEQAGGKPSEPAPTANVAQSPDGSAAGSAGSPTAPLSLPPAAEQPQTEQPLIALPTQFPAPTSNGTGTNLGTEPTTQIALPPSGGAINR